MSFFRVLFVFVIIAITLSFHLKGNSPMLMEALLACIIGPRALTAAVIVQKLSGNLREMATYTFLSDLITVLLIPICFSLTKKTSGITFMGAFPKIPNQVCLVLVVPMGSAYVIEHYFHRFRRWIVNIKDPSCYLRGCSLMIAAGTTMKNIVYTETSVHFFLLIALLGLPLCVIQSFVGCFIGHYFSATINVGQTLDQRNIISTI